MARIVGIDYPETNGLRSDSPIFMGSAAPESQDLSVGNSESGYESPRSSEDEVSRIRQTIEEQGSVRRLTQRGLHEHQAASMEIGFLPRIIRHRKSLPVHGQRTHTNARTRKGPRKGAIAGKKKPTGKT